MHSLCFSGKVYKLRQSRIAGKHSIESTLAMENLGLCPSTSPLNALRTHFKAVDKHLGWTAPAGIFLARNATARTRL